MESKELNDVYNGYIYYDSDWMNYSVEWQLRQAE